MKFTYKARTKDGKIEIGSIEAYSKEAAANLLWKYNFFVTSLEEPKETVSFLKRDLFGGRASKKDLSIFFRQLSVMLESHVPILQSLASLANETKSKNLRETIHKISTLVEEGIPLSQALAIRPEIFSAFHVNLVKSGEASGKIAPALRSISDHLEREADIASQVKQAMVYPLFLVVVLFVVIGVVIVQIVPKIEELIRGTGNKPNGFTATMLGMYKFLGTYWWFIFLVAGFVVISLILYFKSADGKKEYSKLSLRAPVLGAFLKKVFLIRFANNISTLLVAGVSINRALEIAGDTVDNDVYRKVIDDVKNQVAGGEKLSQAMAKYPQYFSPFVLQITTVGEATGKLDQTLMDIVSFYNKDIKRSVDLFSRLLEPIMIIILGLVVTLLAVSVLSSIYGAINVV